MQQLDAKEILEGMNLTREYREKLLEGGVESARGLIRAAKENFARISSVTSYGYENLDSEDKQQVEDAIDWGMRYLELLNSLISNEAFENKQVVTQCKDAGTDWVYIKDVENPTLPETHENILFSTIAGQVFEGYYETTDHSTGYITEDGKIAFKGYKEGGAFYRYRFCDFLNQNLIVAWAYKPAAAKYERRKK